MYVGIARKKRKKENLYWDSSSKLAQCNNACFTATTKLGFPGWLTAQALHQHLGAAALSMQLSYIEISHS